MNVDSLLDRAKEAQGFATDAALAKALGVTKAAVSGWRHGNRFPDAVTCAALAGLTGEPLARVLGVVGEARALSREEKAVWRKLASTAAALAIVGLCVVAGHTDAAVSMAYVIALPHSTYYVPALVGAAALLATVALWTARKERER